jgi:hypothetical protein
MKKNIFFTFLLCLFLTDSLLAQNRNDIIINYEPVQSDVVGKTLVSINNNGQSLFGNKIPNLVTKDEASSSEETKEFNKRFVLGISTILKVENLKDFKAEATNIKVTNINNDVETLPTGSKIIMSGLKADSVVITMTKKSNYNLSLNQLLDKIKKFAPVSEASVLNVLSLIDSANYMNNKTLKIVIRNPTVFYALIFGQVKSEYANNAYLDIKNALNGKTTLSLNSTTDRILPKSSSSFTNTGFARHFLISTKVNETGEPELYVQATKADGGVDEIKVTKTGSNYSATGLLFKSIVLGKVTKKYYVDIRAHLSEDGKSIIIDSGEIRYPEWVFNAIKRKNLQD